jgi:hypothetical protein
MIGLSGQCGLFRSDKHTKGQYKLPGLLRITARPWVAKYDERFGAVILKTAWYTQALKAERYTGPVTQADIDALTALLDSMEGRANG